MTSREAGEQTRLQDPQDSVSEGESQATFSGNGYAMATTDSFLTDLESGSEPRTALTPTICDESSLSAPDCQKWWSDPEERLADMEIYYSACYLSGGGGVRKGRVMRRAKRCKKQDRPRHSCRKNRCTRYFGSNPAPLGALLSAIFQVTAKSA